MRAMYGGEDRTSVAAALPRPGVAGFVPSSAALRVHVGGASLANVVVGSAAAGTRACCAGGALDVSASLAGPGAAAETELARGAQHVICLWLALRSEVHG